MKKKVFNKLAINKATIANLNNVKGGWVPGPTGKETDNCPTTNYPTVGCPSQVCTNNTDCHHGTRGCGA